MYEVYICMHLYMTTVAITGQVDWVIFLEIIVIWGKCIQNYNILYFENQTKILFLWYKPVKLKFGKIFLGYGMLTVGNLQVG